MYKRTFTFLFIQITDISIKFNMKDNENVKFEDKGYLSTL